MLFGLLDWSTEVEWAAVVLGAIASVIAIWKAIIEIKAWRRQQQRERSKPNIRSLGPSEPEGMWTPWENYPHP
jgi:hypothetical protein